MASSWEQLRPLLLAWLDDAPGAAEVLGDFLADRGDAFAGPTDDDGKKVDAVLLLLPPDLARQASMHFATATLRYVTPSWEADFSLDTLHGELPHLFAIVARVFLSSQPLPALGRRLPFLFAASTPPHVVASACRKLIGFATLQLGDEPTTTEACLAEAADEQIRLLLALLAADAAGVALPLPK
ncbi:hypothetical protein [Lignipirellula cremea]|uniref:Uncharacterized protein n=1 Tax=Lignipirellula cremea TaxID=2528010 RepID=A0A518DZI4_9BACT|nr:hypothetical protein [Lignipirellula cremea]QDU97239.1 hypothetical protein Pla8534_50840 [Lignipirellula cremea]